MFDPRRPADALRLAQACYGETILLRPRLGTNHPVYEADVGPDRLPKVLKLAITPFGDSLAKELRLMRLLAERGLPVAQVDDADLDGSRWGWPALAMASAGRENLFDCIRQPGKAKYSLFRQMGQVLGQIHALTWETSGEIRATEIVPHQAEAYWSGLVAWSGELAKAGLLTVAEAGCFAALSAPEIEGRHLCHSDFHAVQCLHDGNRITAVVDWESAWAGNPLVDLAITAAYLDFYSPPALIDEFYAGYRSVQTLPPGFARDYLPVRLAQTLAVLRAWHQRGAQAWRTAIDHQRVGRVLELYRRYLRELD